MATMMMCCVMYRWFSDEWYFNDVRRRHSHAAVHCQCILRL